MNYREKVRKAIECPQFGNTYYGEWGALRLDQRRYIKRLLDDLKGADVYILKLYKEKQELKEQLEASEKARKEAIEYIKNNQLYEEEYDYNYDDELELLGINSNQAENDLLDILDIDKGE